MKRFLFLLLCLPTVLTAQWRMVSSSVSLNSTVDDSTYVIDVDFFSDLTGGGYLATGITADFLVFSQSGELYDITVATNLTLSSGRLTIVEVDNDYVDTEGAPTGQIIVYDPQGEYIPVTPFGNSNMGNVLQGAALAYNSKIKNQLAIATIDDTSSVISPYEGQLVYIKDAGNYQVRGAYTWSALDPGGGGSGDVTGPGTSTDEAVARYNGTGNTIQNSLVTIDDSGNINTSGTVDGRDVSADGTKLDAIGSSVCNEVLLIPNDGLDDIAAIDAAMASYDCITIGTEITDTIDISRPITPPRSNMKIEINGYVKIMNTDSVLLTARVDTGDDTISVSNTASFAVGQWISITDTVMPVQGSIFATRRESVGGKITEVIDANNLVITPPVNLSDVRFTRNYIDPSSEGKVGIQNSAILLENVDNVVVTGSGILDVNASNSIDRAPLSVHPVYGLSEELRQTCGVSVSGCRNTTIEGVEIRDAGLHGLAYHHSDVNNVYNVTVKNYSDKGLVNLVADTFNIDGLKMVDSHQEDGLALYGSVSQGTFKRIHVDGAPRNPILIRTKPGGNLYFEGITVENTDAAAAITVEDGEGSGSVNIVGVRVTNSSGNALSISTDNVNVSNIIADSISTLVGITGDNVNISNFSAIGKNDGAGQFIRIGGSNNATISNGSGANFATAIFQTAANTNVKINSVSVKNVTTASIPSTTSFTLSNCSGFKASSGWLLSSNGANLSSYTRQIGNDFYFSEPNETGTGLTSKFHFMDRNNPSSYTGLNTLNVRGGLSIAGGVLGAQFSTLSTATFTLGPTGALPTSTIVEHYIIDINSAALTEYNNNDFILGTSPANNSNFGVTLGINPKPSVYLNRNGANMAFTGGQANDVTVKGISSQAYGFLFSNSAKPRLYIEAHNNTPRLRLRRAGGTGISPSQALSGQSLGIIESEGAQVGGFAGVNEVGARITFEAAENQTSSATGTNILFSTANVGSNTLTQKLAIPASGGLNVGSGSFTASVGIINAQTGYRLNDAATSGSYLRGNGTNIVLSTIQESDLPVRPATDITVAATPTDYTPDDGTVEGHLSGIDTQLGTITALIPDNIADLTISASIDASDEKIINLAAGTASTDAVNKSQLDAANSFTTIAPSNGDTIVLTNIETLIVVDGTLADPATFYIDGSSLPSKSKVYIKYGNFSGNATFDRDDDNDPGNFSATGSTSGTTTLTYTGTGFSAWLKSGATWYQMY